jgi:membrane protease YdiL (CAAX protease family)
MSKFIQYTFYVRRKNLLLSILILFSTFLVFYAIWLPFYYFILKEFDCSFFPTPNETILEQSYFTIILQVMIFGPLIETLICQKGVFTLLSYFKWLKQRKLLIILLSAFIFGFLHFFSLSYIIFNFFIGVLFMYTYIVMQGKHAYWAVVLLHSLINLFAVLSEPIEKIIFKV